MHPTAMGMLKIIFLSFVWKIFGPWFILEDKMQTQASIEATGTRSGTQTQLWCVDQLKKLLNDAGGEHFQAQSHCRLKN